MAGIDPGVMERVAEAELIASEAIADDEPKKEEILASIRRGLEDVKAGRTRPARQALAEIRRKPDCNGHAC